MKRLKRNTLLLLVNKLIEKVSGRCNAKQHYESHLIRKNMRSVKQSEKNTFQQIFDTGDIKSVNTEYSKTSHKLSRTIKQVKRIGSCSSLYSDKNFLNEKNIKITKRKHAFMVLIILKL